MLVVYRCFQKLVELISPSSRRPFFCLTVSPGLVIESFLGHINMRCRGLFYDICTILYDRRSRLDVGEEMDAEDEECDISKFFHDVRVCLLQGILLS